MSKQKADNSVKSTAHVDGQLVEMLTAIRADLKASAHACKVSGREVNDPSRLRGKLNMLIIAVAKALDELHNATQLVSD